MTHPSRTYSRHQTQSPRREAIRYAGTHNAPGKLYRPVWSERILDEARRAMRKVHPDIGEDQIARRFATMNEAFEDACVFGWEVLEASVVLPDIDDRHVVACAVRAGADAILTENSKDFPASTLAPLGIELVTDTRTHGKYTDIVRQNPPKPISDVARRPRLTVMALSLTSSTYSTRSCDEAAEMT